MLDATTLYPPAHYLAVWLILAAAAFLLGLWLLAYAAIERPRFRLAALFRRRAKADTGPGLQEQYLERIAAIEAGVKAGLIGSRDAHQRLAGLVRDFAFEAQGLPAQDATLEELQERGLDEVAAVIERFYPAEFQKAAYEDPLEAVGLAREVVASWR
jgi:hypothetical protein